MAISSTLIIQRLCCSCTTKLGISHLNTISLSSSSYFTKITQHNKRHYTTNNMLQLTTPLDYNNNNNNNNNNTPCVIDSNRELRSTDLVSLEYADLNLTDKTSGELGHVRIRQHVNPLSQSFSVPAPVPDWKEVFKDPTLPLMVDIGSGSGRFLIWLAKRDCSQNYLGLEIRQKLVKRAEYWVEQLGLSNINFTFANASNSFEQLVSSYPGPLTLVSILCPDPHFKKRHQKRRVVQKPLVDSIVANLKTGGKVFIQSDVLDVALDMREQLDSMGDVLERIEIIDPSTECDNGDTYRKRNPCRIRGFKDLQKHVPEEELAGWKFFLYYRII